MKTKPAGETDTQSFTFAHPPDELKLECGKTLGPITLAYETYGELNDQRSNAILVEHTFSGDAHAAGIHREDGREGWWDFMIGPKKAIDTEKYFVICSNILGGCKGSTGPSSVNSKTGKPYALDFPFVTIPDMVRAQKHLIDHLGVPRLLGVIGGSMGGMLALQWASLYPESVRSIIPIATTLKHFPQQIAFDEVGRQAVMADPDWAEGHYYGKAKPEKGLAVARMIGHITYMSDQSMEEKFSRRLKEQNMSFKFTAADFEVEGYLRHRGDNFVRRFDANSYLYLTKAMDYFDVSGEKLIPKGRHYDLTFLVIAFKSDWLYPAYQSQEIIRQLRLRHINATYCEINSRWGHDAFLMENAQQEHLVKHFLGRLKP
jgi:homoserine O-acetyltransferase